MASSHVGKRRSGRGAPSSPSFLSSPSFRSDGVDSFSRLLRRRRFFETFGSSLSTVASSTGVSSRSVSTFGSRRVRGERRRRLPRLRFGDSSDSSLLTTSTSASTAGSSSAGSSSTSSSPFSLSSSSFNSSMTARRRRRVVRRRRGRSSPSSLKS